MSRSLHDAILSGNEDEIITRLNMGEDVNQSFPPRYCSPLHTAVHCGREVVVGLLLSRGAAVNAGDREGLTPLAIASSQDARGLVKILTAAGGTKTPSTLPSVDERPDPLFSQPPPWLAQHTPVQGKDEAASVAQPKESLYGFLKKGAKVIASKQNKAVSDSIKPFVIEEPIIKKDEDEEIKKCSYEHTDQNYILSFANEPKESVMPYDQSEEIKEQESIKEESIAEINDINIIKETKLNKRSSAKIDVPYVMKNMKEKCVKKLSKTKTEINCDTKQEENLQTNSKLKTLYGKISAKRKDSKQSINNTKDVNLLDKIKGIPNQIRKSKRFISSHSDSNKQATENDNEKLDSIEKSNKQFFSKLKGTKMMKRNRTNIDDEIQKPEANNLNKNDKLEKLKTYREQLLKKMKSHKTEEEKTESIKAESTIGFKIQNNFESIKSRMTKQRIGVNDQKVAESDVIKSLNKIEIIKKKCSSLFKHEGQDKKRSKVSNSLRGIQLKLPSLTKSEKSNTENGKTTSKNKTLNFSNNGSRVSKEKTEPDGEEINLYQPSQLNFNKRNKEVQLRMSETSKFQWIMIDGQWRKSQSVGL